MREEKLKKGFSCRKCGGNKSKKGHLQYDIRCKTCGYNESPTAHTLFHAIKIALPTAFEMVYRVSVNKKGISSLSLSREYDVNPKTAYNFKQKIQQSMKSSECHLLTQMVHVDEFMYGGKEKDCQGRSNKCHKLKICIAMESIVNKQGKTTIGRAYGLSIENFSNEELDVIFQKYICPNSEVITDKWSGYLPSKKTHNIVQKKSDNGSNFPDIHNLIMNIKSWIRGIHHKVSKEHIQKYLNEFFFRLNRRMHMEKMPVFALNRMIEHPPNPVKLTKGGFYG
ncbi:MAG: IS1595 family transposase [Chitinophagales bacterium]